MVRFSWYSMNPMLESKKSPCHPTQIQVTSSTSVGRTRLLTKKIEAEHFVWENNVSTYTNHQLAAVANLQVRKKGFTSWKMSGWNLQTNHPWKERKSHLPNLHFLSSMVIVHSHHTPDLVNHHCHGETKIGWKLAHLKSSHWSLIGCHRQEGQQLPGWWAVAFAWRIIPFSKWLVSPIYKPFRPFGMGITPFGGLTITMVINHLLTGMFLQVWAWPTGAPSCT